MDGRVLIPECERVVFGGSVDIRKPICWGRMMSGTGTKDSPIGRGMSMSIVFAFEKGTSRTGVVYRAQGPSYWAAGRTCLRASLRGWLG
eukprot:9493519-Pyramimonas_sp.AAC.2